MAQSPEYPDLPWMPPKSWTDANRTAVQLVVIHTTEGSAHARSAEDGAAYDQRRTDGTSTHYFHDSDSTVQCVRTNDRAHTARTQGNRRGIHHELCTRAGKADWSDAYHQAMLRRAAKQAARDAEKWDIPVRHLTVAQVAAGLKGFCGHVDITYAFPQDNGTHTDPGGAFPWSTFLDMVRDELRGDDVPVTSDEIAAIATATVEKLMERKITDAVDTATPKRQLSVETWLGWSDGREITTRNTILAALGRLDLIDEAKLATEILAVLTPQAIAAALPQDIAEQVARELAARLAS